MGLLLAGAVFMPAAALAQGPGRLEDELALTDRRIELAESIVGASSDPAPLGELAAARDLQQRARGAVSGQPLAALRLTREARGRADRAIAMVRGLPDPDRVVTQVERTRELLDRARERVEECQEPRGRNLIRVAVEMQVRAETALRESRYLAALQLTMSARERLFQALRTCRVEESAQDGAARAIERTDDVLSRARVLVEASSSEAARQALSRAESVQMEARTEFRAERYEVSLRLTQAARALGHRAIRLAGPGTTRR
jgi:hypothetical protein